MAVLDVAVGDRGAGLVALLTADGFGSARPRGSALVAQRVTIEGQRELGVRSDPCMPRSW